MYREAFGTVLKRKENVQMAKAEKEKQPVERREKEEKKKALDAVFKVIEKEYGTGSIMKLGDTHVASVDAIPTGSMTLDMALGVGGLPRGRIVEIYGPESSGNIDRKSVV